MLFTDWNQSGTPSLRVTNDRQYYRGGEEQMWHVDPGKLPRLYTAAEGWRHLSIWGMGIAEADLNGDGYPEYALTSMGDTKLQQLDNEDGGEDRPVYRDIAFDRGATAQRPYTGGDRRPSTGWHSQFADVNNDGLLDLFIAKGNVEAMPDFAAYDPNNLLLGAWDGQFAEAGDAAGIATADARPRRGAWSTSTWTACSTWSWSIATVRRASSATSARPPTGATRRSATGSRSSSTSPASTATRSAPTSP